MMDAEYVPLLTEALRGYFKEEELLDLCRLFDVPSMITSKPAIDDHPKTGQRRASETGLF